MLQRTSSPWLALFCGCGRPGQTFARARALAFAAIVACACHDEPASSAGPTDATMEGRPASKGESWVWVFRDFGSSLDAIAAHPWSFTDVSPTLYTVNYAYTSGVGIFSNCPKSGNACTGAGTDDFGGGLSSAQMAERIASSGLSCVPLIFGGARNRGIDTGVQRLLDDAPAGTREAFIQAMVGEASAKRYAGYNLDFEVSPSLDASYAAKLLSFVTEFASKLHATGMTLSIDVIGANVLQSQMSGASGFVDLPKLAASPVDRVVFEDYFGRFGIPSAPCAATVDPLPCSDDFTSFLNLVCTDVPAAKSVIGLESLPTATNPFAQQALRDAARRRDEPCRGLAQDRTRDGVRTTYAFLDPEQLSPGGTWYALLQQYLANAK